MSFAINYILGLTAISRRCISSLCRDCAPRATRGARFVKAVMVWGACFAAPVEAKALDAKQVFEKVSPSVVEVNDLDCQGSGIVLTADGLIVTSYHVVAAHLELKVRAKVKSGSKLVPVEIDNVKLLKVHPEYDLALLQATPSAKSAFVPAQILPRNAAVETGGKCYPIGNAGGFTDPKFTLSITEGLVSAASRRIEGFDWIQFSAAVNPGSSGGPLCDDQGRVIGVTTWKFEDTEGVSFAIPIQKLALNDFVVARPMKRDAALMQRADFAASQFYQMGQRCRNMEEAAPFFEAAAECYRIMMLAAPDNPEPCNNLGYLYYEAGKKDLARKFFEAALRIDDSYTWSCYLLGKVMMEQKPGDKQVLEQCLQLWWRGLASGENKAKEPSSFCASNLAVALFRDFNKPTAGAYMLGWADAILPPRDDHDDNDMKRRNQMWTDLKNVLPPAELAAIRSKDGNYSKLEFNVIMAGKALASLSRSAPAPEESKLPSMVDAALLAKTADQTAAKFTAQQEAVPEEGLKLPLPGQARNAILANAGCQILMHFPELGKIGIFNLPKAKFDGFVDCPDKDALFTTGGQILVVYLPSTGNFERYDLNSQERLSSQMSPLGGAVRFITMGLKNPAWLFALGESKDKAGNDYYAPYLLKLPDLSVTSFSAYSDSGINLLQGLPLGSKASPVLQGGADENGLNFAIWETNAYQPSMVSYSLKSSAKMEAFGANLMDIGHVHLSRDGDYVIQKSKVFSLRSDEDLYSKVKRVPAYGILAPVAGYQGFVEHFPETGRPDEFLGFRLRALPAMNVVADISVTKEVCKELKVPSGGNKGDAILLASAYCNRLAYLLTQEKQIYLFNLGFQGDSVAQPGKHFERKIGLQSGAEVLLQGVPAGLRYDSAKSILVWDVPANFRTGQMVHVLMLVKSAGEKPAYHIEKISVP